MEETKVRVRIKPLKGIGGIGNAGDEVMMTPEEAEMYFRDGYVEYVKTKDEEGSDQSAVISDQSTVQAEDHAIMKPEARRSGKVVKKK